MEVFILAGGGREQQRDLKGIDETRVSLISAAEGRIGIGAEDLHAISLQAAAAADRQTEMGDIEFCNLREVSS